MVWVIYTYTVVSTFIDCGYIIFKHTAVTNLTNNPPLTELGDGAIAGAVIGALLGAVLIILIIWYMTHSMKKQKYKASKATEMQ
jgi:O-antigen/teichoic acid export membrane protein